MFCLELRSEMRLKLGLLCPSSLLALALYHSQAAAHHYMDPSWEFWSPKVPLIAFKSDLCGCLTNSVCTGPQCLQASASHKCSLNLFVMQRQSSCSCSACNNILPDQSSETLKL